MQLDKKSTSRNVQALEMRKKMLKTARFLFAKNGYHATSMRSINRAVGMSDALTYHYFPGGKLEIFNEVINLSQEERGKDMISIFNSFTENTLLYDALLVIIKKMGERFVFDQEFIQIMIQERKLIVENAKSVFAVNDSSFADCFVSYLKKLCDKGVIRKMDLSMAVSQFLCHIGMIALHQIMYSAEFNLDQYLIQAEKIAIFTSELWSIQ